MAAGCAKVFREKVSGAKTDRPELAKVIRRLEPGDVLMVTRLDRLARSTRDLLNVLAAIAERGAGFKSLKDTWADTTTAHGRLMLTVLSRPVSDHQFELPHKADRCVCISQNFKGGRAHAAHSD
jgi:DNA invertase Pin-like site-specific DNA recombinase